MEKGPAASSEVSDRAFQAISFDAVQGKVIIGFLSYLCLNMSFNFHVSLPLNHLELANIALFLFCICVCLCSLRKVSYGVNWHCKTCGHLESNSCAAMTCVVYVPQILMRVSFCLDILSEIFHEIHLSQTFQLGKCFVCSLLLSFLDAS